MSQIEYKKMSLFDAPEGSILVHACNSQGVWGSGIAKEFKERFPEDYLEYKSMINFHNRLSGSTCGLFGRSEKTGWLVTSHNYGDLKDSPEQIKINTTLALVDLCLDGPMLVYSNKFNSGLFAVPWEETELILKSVLRMFPDIKWVVCDPDLER